MVHCESHIGYRPKESESHSRFHSPVEKVLADSESSTKRRVDLKLMYRVQDLSSSENLARTDYIKLMFHNNNRSI